MDRIVRRKQLLDLIGVSCTTQWRMERAGQFPARVKIGKGLVGWHLVEVEKWLEGRERVGRCSPGGKPLGSGSGQPGVGCEPSCGPETVMGSEHVPGEN